MTRREKKTERWEYYSDDDDDCRVVLIGMCGEISFLLCPFLFFSTYWHLLLVGNACEESFFSFSLTLDLCVGVCVCVRPHLHSDWTHRHCQMIVVCSVSMNHRWWEDWPREKEIARENERRTMSNSRQNADDNQSSVIIDRRAGDDGKSFSLLFSLVFARAFLFFFFSSSFEQQ